MYFRHQRDIIKNILGTERHCNNSKTTLCICSECHNEIIVMNELAATYQVYNGI